MFRDVLFSVFVLILTSVLLCRTIIYIFYCYPSHVLYAFTAHVIYSLTENGVQCGYTILTCFQLSTPMFQVCPGDPDSLRACVGIAKHYFSFFYLLYGSNLSCQHVLYMPTCAYILVCRKYFSWQYNLMLIL